MRCRAKKQDQGLTNAKSKTFRSVMAKKSKKKSNSASLEQLESKCSPILEIKSTDENYFFNVVPHPSKPLLSIGLATGHVFTLQYDAANLQKHVNDQKRVKAKKDENSSSSDVEKSKASGNKIFWKKFNLEELAEGNFDQEYIKILWKTKRHKGSCRCLVFDPKDDGETMYSIGTDNILKKANSMSGKVIKKVDLNSVLSEEENAETSKVKFTKMVKSPTHDFLLLGSENGNVIVLDSNSLKVTNNELQKIHMGDAINDMFQYVKKSVYKYISLGQTTMASWDSRPLKKGTSVSSNDTVESNSNRSVHLSDDQEDEILCGTFVNPDEDDTIVCGMGEGILTLWKSSKNDLQDQLSRIKIAKGESIDCIVPTLQDDNCVWCGCSNGNIYKVNTKMGKIVEIRKHSKFDEVTFLDLDYDYRVVSGGMDSLRIWEFVEDGDGDGNGGTDVVGGESGSDNDSSPFGGSSSDDDSMSEDDSLSESDSLQSDDSQIWEELSDKNTQPDSQKQDVKAELLAELESSDAEEEEEEEEEVVEEDGQTKNDAEKSQEKNNKKHKLDTSDKNTKQTPSKKTKKQLIKAKQLKNMHNHEHGIRKFEGL